MSDENKAAKPSGRDPARIEDVLAVLRETWEARPQFRLGQLISCVGTEVPNSELYYMEDDELLRRLSHFHATVKKQISK